MNRMKISLDAARIIALTAMLGFVDGRYKVEDSDISRSRIALVNTSKQINDPSLDRAAYLVEFQRGLITKTVLVDARTGKVLPS
ncbi:MAG: PepSY domain-containing protein [Gallionella sp.]